MKRKHADLIKLWADNDDCDVYIWNGMLWLLVKKPSWHPHEEYLAITREWKEIWDAYLEGKCIQVKTLSDNWKDVKIINFKKWIFGSRPDLFKVKPDGVKITLNDKECVISEESAKEFQEALNNHFKDVISKGPEWEWHFGTGEKRDINGQVWECLPGYGDSTEFDGPRWRIDGSRWKKLNYNRNQKYRRIK